jgi:hypothetical protein
MDTSEYPKHHTIITYTDNDNPPDRVTSALSAGSFEFGGVNDGLEKEKDEGRFERFSLSSALENWPDAQLIKLI